MASKTAILSVRVVSDVKNAVQGLDEVATRSEKLESGLKKAAAPAAGVVAALGIMGKAAIDSASELQQSTGAIEAVFGDSASQIEDSARRAAQSVGLSASEYENLSAVLGAQLRNMGTPMEDLASKTENLTSLGADLAATYGGTTADAVAAISSLLRGERDPIERYGVSIKAADVQARLAAEGLDGLTGEAAKAAESQVTLALLAEQTAQAQGQFARETDSAAGAQQIAAASFENAKAALGEHLLPAVTAVTQATTKAIEWTAQHSTTVLILGGVVGGLAATILAANGAMAAYQAVQTALRVATMAQTAAQAALNTVMSLNPVGLVVAALAALAAGLVYAYRHSETFRNGVNALWDYLRRGAAIAGQAIQPIADAFGRVVSAVQNAYNWVRNLFSNFQPPAWLSKVTSFVGGSTSQAAGIFAAAGDTTGGGSLPVALWRPASAPETTTGTTINITVNGALDPVSVAEQIRRILAAYDRRAGGVSIGVGR